MSGFAGWPHAVGVQTLRAEARAASTSPACASVRGAEEKLGMSGWLRAVLLGAMLMVGTWALLVLLAHRLDCSAT